MKFRLNEMYQCLQGEGTRVGLPSLLVRFQICNLRCTWCDTPYTHTLKSDTSKLLETTELVEFVAEHIGQSQNIIFSGGEPTLYDLSTLASEIQRKFPHVLFEVETNGTQIPHEKFKSWGNYSVFQWNVSPKGNNANETWNELALGFWANLSISQDNVFFKFVIRKNQVESDIDDVKLFENKFQPRKNSVILMAEGTTPESQLNCTWLEDICIANSWRYSPRLHVLLHGSKRGV